MILMPRLTIGTRTLDEHSEPYVIAEIGVNHEGSMEKALELIGLAKAGGADAAKFQTYKAEALASRDSPSYWDVTKEVTRSQYELFQKYDGFGEDQYRALAERCAQVGIDFLSTPFDLHAVDFLAPLVPAFKIASADLTNIPLLRQIASHAQPAILSVGASTLGEVDIALHTLFEAGCPDVALLHCILNYPTAYEDANLNMIGGLRRAYPELLVGYSDHTPPDLGMVVLTTAYTLGARIIEKHFTHDKTLPGNDHYHAMNADDLRTFRRQVAFVRTIGGRQHKAPLPSEAPARRHARRSIVVDQPLAVGIVLEARMLTCKRPGTGISPLHWDEVVGRRVARPLGVDHVLQWEDLSPLV
jgi:sialic acid synthase SpsE